ncbi:MAG TPA: DUF5677 domain-containing protein [Bryobacteraceae bacterium]|nr:DUF5677 domain-containing protein [Bryobacteraceae bacterium]
MYVSWDGSLDEVVGGAFDISTLDVHSCHDLTRGAFELYKETGMIVNLAASVYVSDDDSEYPLSRNEAIAVGLLVRLSKFMLVVAQLAAENERGDVIFVLNRCILESATNLAYLLQKDEEAVYDQFVLSSFGPEKELFDVIQRNIASRGYQIPIETRMLASIGDACAIAGSKIEDLSRRLSDWGGNMRIRMREIGDEELYAGMQRVPSHAVHGTWMDLYKHHFKGKDGRFAPDPRWCPVDARLLAPIAIWVLNAAQTYLNKWRDEVGAQLILDRCDDLINRLHTVDE